MKKSGSTFFVVLILVLLSVILYAVQIIIFDSPRDTEFYIFQDIAFLPFQIAIVTIVLGKYLRSREKAERLQKINIVINAFFTEAGTEILMNLTSFSKSRADIGSKLNVQADWADSVFSQTEKTLVKTDMQIDCGAKQLEALKELLINKRDFLIRIVENPNLLEHDSFTDMLLSVFHVMEELMARSEFDEGCRADMAHISIDIKRALRSLTIQWVEYMRHLHAEYPYLYSLQVRKNPFSEEQNIVISD